MQMDLWVVAAATGAGYLAKYWKNVVGDKEGSSGFPSGSSFPDNPESSSSIQQSSSHQFSQRETTGQHFSEAEKEKGKHLDTLFTESSRRDDPCSTCNNELDHEKQIGHEEYRDGYRLGSDISDIPEYHTWEMGASHSSGKSRKSLRGRRLQRLPLQYVKPRTSLDSCLMAQMQREHAEMEEYLRTPLSSPCAPAMRPFLVTDGRQVISKAIGDFRNELYKEVHPKADDEVFGVPHLPQITTNGNTKQKLSKGKSQMGKLSSKSIQLDIRDGFLSGQVLFCLGISIGVMSSLIANNGEVEKLKLSLKQTENLVEDLQEELEMKDSLTVKELINDDDSQDIHESSRSHEQLNLFSDQVDTDVTMKFADEESVSLEKTESMSKIEAELEAELERLELSMKGSILQGRSSDAIEFDQEFDQDIASELVHGELNADIFPGKSSSEPTPDRGSTPPSMKDGVSPRELSLRLHEVVQSRLQERIMELETELAKSQKKVQHLELEKHSWKEISQSESSSTLGSPVAQPLVMNLSGDALDAYNEAYGELYKLSAARIGDLGIQGDDQQDILLSINQGMGEKLNGIQNGGNRIPPYEGIPNDYDNRDDSDDDLLLIKQIVEKARQGSPAILRAQKAWYG